MSCSLFLGAGGVYVHSALLLPTQCSDNSFKGGPGNFHLFQETFKINFTPFLKNNKFLFFLFQTKEQTNSKKKNSNKQL